LSESRITDFYRLGQPDRVRLLAERGLISVADAATLLRGDPLLAAETADKMIENVIGVFGLPLAVVPDFLVNGKSFLVPMVVEEPSIVAAVSSVAKLAWNSGGFKVTSADPMLIGQIQLVDIDDPDAVMQTLSAAQDQLLALANRMQPRLQARGGGARDIEYFKYRLDDSSWTVVLHLLVDTRDAMGANIVNTMCEGIAAEIERLSGGRVCLKILSNLTDRALVNATVKLPASVLGRGEISGEQIRDSIIQANDFAHADPYRAATHNKGIMNGMDAVALATGNDWRSLEAGAHAWAARDGAYRALTSWTATADGELLGSLHLPVKVGIVGGSQTSNASAAIGLRIAAAKTAQELAELMAAVGLAQNLAALRALVSDGIQKGHMSLHARSVAAAAGATGELFEQVVGGLIESGDIKPWKASELIDSLQDPVEVAAAAPAENMARGEAAGKVILLGEHAAVYDKHVLALPLRSGIVAGIGERASGTRLAVPDWDFEQQFEIGAAASQGIAGILSLIMQNFGVADRGFDIEVRSRIPAGMGLGSSAALAVAIIRAFDQFSGRGMSDIEVEKLAFECEKISHGTPSGIDNNIATYGQPVLFSKGAAAQPVQLAEVPPLVIAASGVRGNTREQVAAVRARYDRNRELYATIFNEIDKISTAGATALGNRDYEQLGVLMNVCQGFLNSIGVSTAELEQMISIARQHGAIGAKLTGAGGGGSIVALCPGAVDDVAGALDAAGYQIVTMEN